MCCTSPSIICDDTANKEFSMLTCAFAHTHICSHVHVSKPITVCKIPQKSNYLGLQVLRVSSLGVSHPLDESWGSPRKPSFHRAIVHSGVVWQTTVELSTHPRLPGGTTVELSTHPQLPRGTTVELSTHPRLPRGTTVELSTHPQLPGGTDPWPPVTIDNW